MKKRTIIYVCCSFMSLSLQHVVSAEKPELVVRCVSPYEPAIGEYEITISSDWRSAEMKGNASPVVENFYMSCYVYSGLNFVCLQDGVNEDEASYLQRTADGVMNFILMSSRFYGGREVLNCMQIKI